MRLPFVKRALPLVGYLVSTFNDQQTGIMQYLSKGADAYNFQALNGGKPTVTSSVLTHGTRDPFVLVGPNRSSFWMLATDLDIAKTSWGESQTHGSRSIVVWSSSDLVSWKQQAPVELEGPEAGYVWAPSALYYNGEYVVFWSSRIYQQGDVQRLKPPMYTTIRYSKTKDFKTFTKPQNYIESDGAARIDQEFVEIGNGEYVRFIKNESNKSITVEKSQGGIFGKWTMIGTKFQDREGPAAFRDITDPNTVHLWVDKFGGPGGYGYDAWETTNIASGVFQRSAQTVTPAGFRHGTVTPLTSDEYARIAAKYSISKAAAHH